MKPWQTSLESWQGAHEDLPLNGESQTKAPGQIATHKLAMRVPGGYSAKTAVAICL